MSFHVFWKLARPFLLVMMLVAQANAQTIRDKEPLPYTDSTMSLKSPEERILKRRGVFDADPNIYGYTREFAKRFQMPEQWIEADLQGAEAVAFRVMPYYKSCGWNGDPNSCNENEMRCMLDVYFDHKKQPLPWDERVQKADFDVAMTSANFLMRAYRPTTNFFGKGILPRHPFTDPVSGKELGWQDWHQGNSVGGWVGMRSYNREIYKDVSMVTLGAGCNNSPSELWLASRGLNKKEVDAGTGGLSHRIILPSGWISRVKESLVLHDRRRSAFLQKEGEKALKSLRENPAMQAPVSPTMQ